MPFVPRESLGVLVRLSRQIRRPALALVVVGSLTALALPAGAATATPAKGTATSSVTVLRLTISGTTITAGQIAAVAANATKPHQAKLVVRHEHPDPLVSRPMPFLFVDGDGSVSP